MFITVGGTKPISIVKRKKGTVHFNQSSYTLKSEGLMGKLHPPVSIRQNTCKYM